MLAHMLNKAKCTGLNNLKILIKTKLCEWVIYGRTVIPEHQGHVIEQASFVNISVEVLCNTFKTH